MLPPFYKLGTLADMSRMARKMGLARGAIKEIRKLEDYLEVNKTNVSEDELSGVMKGVNYYALIVAGAMRDAVTILTGVKSKTGSYRELVKDAVD